MWLRNGADDFRMSELVLLTGEEFVLQVPIDRSSDPESHPKVGFESVSGFGFRRLKPTFAVGFGFRVSGFVD